MVLKNNVYLENDVPAKMHFYDHFIDDRRTITDPKTGRPSGRSALVLYVDHLNDQPVTAEFSTLAEKLASQLGPYLEGKKYADYDFTITQHGDGWQRSWTVQAIPRAR